MAETKMLPVLVLVCLKVVIAIQNGNGKEIPTPSYLQQQPATNGQQKSDVDVIIARRRQYETIRLAGFLTLRAIEQTRFRSVELTSILQKREDDIKNLFKRVPYIVAYLVNKNPEVEIPMPKISFYFLTTAVGKGQEEVTDVPTFLESYFKEMNSSRTEAEVKSLRMSATFQMKRLIPMIGQNYLGSTMVRIDESVGFMNSELNKTRDMLMKLPELVKEVMIGPYDTISEDRIMEGYRKMMKNSD